MKNYNVHITGDPEQGGKREGMRQNFPGLTKS